MSVSLKINNYNALNIKEVSTLNADSVVGSGSLTLTNNNNIIANDYILIGTPGSEASEILAVQSASGSTLVTTANTTLPHYRNDSVEALIGNQLKIYRAPDINGLQPVDANYAVIATISIDGDQLSTNYTDATGGAGYWYKFTYFNQVTSTETALADSSSARGGGIGDYATLESIREEAGFKGNRNLSEDRIDRHRQAAQDYINGELSGMFTLPFQAPVNRGIVRIAMMLAAGYLQTDLYGSSFNTDPTTGKNNKILWAEAQLDKVKSGQFAVTDATGVDIAITGSGGMSGYPNATTASNTDCAEDFMFKREDIAGYRNRVY